ncbi:MAG: flagellar basal body-associated FliL family protein [Devosia sp.]
MDDDEVAAVEPPAKSGPGGLILALVLVTVLGSGAGGFLGSVQFDQIQAIATKRANEPPEKVETALAWDETSAVADIEPVLANLAAPSGTFVRIDSAMVFDRESVDDVARMQAELSQDILTYARTLNMAELQGASALNHIRDDLNERVRATSNGTVSELILKSLVVQ